MKQSDGSARRRSLDRITAPKRILQWFQWKVLYLVHTSLDWITQFGLPLPSRSQRCLQCLLLVDNTSTSCSSKFLGSKNGQQSKYLSHKISANGLEPRVSITVCVFSSTPDSSSAVAASSRYRTNAVFIFRIVPNTVRPGTFSVVITQNHWMMCRLVQGGSVQAEMKANTDPNFRQKVFVVEKHKHPEPISNTTGRFTDSSATPVITVGWI